MFSSIRIEDHNRFNGLSTCKRWIKIADTEAAQSCSLFQLHNTYQCAGTPSSTISLSRSIPTVPNLCFSIIHIWCGWPSNIHNVDVLNGNLAAKTGVLWEKKVPYRWEGNSGTERCTFLLVLNSPLMGNSPSVGSPWHVNTLFLNIQHSLVVEECPSPDFSTALSMNQTHSDWCCLLPLVVVPAPPSHTTYSGGRETIWGTDCNCPVSSVCTPVQHTHDVTATLSTLTWIHGKQPVVSDSCSKSLYHTEHWWHISLSFNNKQLRLFSNKFNNEQ